MGKLTDFYKRQQDKQLKSIKEGTKLAPGESYRRPLDFSPILSRIPASATPPLASGNDGLLDAAAQTWKTDQQILFDNMINGTNLIENSMTPLDFHIQKLDEAKIVGWDSENRPIREVSDVITRQTKTLIAQVDKPYKNFVKVNNENSLTFISELTKNPGVYGFLNIPTPILSFLVPRVRIYKARYKTEKPKDPILVEFSFDDHFRRSDVEAITTSARDRGSGAGITSFTWDTQGTNQFTGDKLIAAQLNLHFESIQDFSFDRESPNVREGNKIITSGEDVIYRYSQLIVPSTKTLRDPCDPKEGFYNEKYYRIMVDVGWAIPQNIDDNEIWEIITRYNRSTEEKLQITPTTIRETVSNLNTQMFLTSPRHQISYNQDGTVDISVDYNAYVNRVMGNPKVDIFRLSEIYESYQRRLASFEENKETLNKKFLTLEKQSQESFEKEASKLSKELEQQKAEFKGDRVIFYNSVIQKLLENQVIYNIDFVWEGDKNILKSGLEGIILPTITIPGSFCQGDINKSIESQAVARQISHSIYYFFLGDLLDVLYEVLYTSGVTSFKEVRPLVGNFEYYDLNNNRVGVNIADIPISLSYFNLFLKREFVDAAPDTYILDRFLQNFLGGFLFPLLNSSNAKGMVNTQRFTVSANIVNAPTNGIDPINDVFEENDTQYSGIVKQVRDIPRSGEDFSIPFSYYILFAASSGRRLFREGNFIKAEIRDRSRGIYWIRAGQDVGALKEASFERSDIPYYREYLIMRPSSNRTSNNEGNIDDVKFLKEKYDAKLTFFGIPNIVPAQYIYVEPVSFGLNEPDPGTTTTQQLGYSGYYIVHQVNHKIERGVYETFVHAKWETSGVKIETLDGRECISNVERILGIGAQGPLPST